MKEPREYKLKIPVAMLNCLTEDNLENFIEGMAQSLRFYMDIVKYARVSKPDGKNTDLVKNYRYTYIDDSKQEKKAIIRVKTEEK